MLAVAPQEYEPQKSSNLSLRQHAVRFKAWSIMVAVAIVAICCSVATHIESSLSNALAIIVSCAACLTYRRYFESLALRQARGLITSETEKRILLARSAMFAVMILGLSDAAFMTGYYGFLKVGFLLGVAARRSPHDDPVFIILGGGVGMVLALKVASWLRSTVWPLEGEGASRGCSPQSDPERTLQR
jgi:hypothetical protein